LSAFDVRNGESPRAVSTVSLTNAQYDSEEVFATNGLVYISHKTVTADVQPVEVIESPASDPSVDADDVLRFVLVNSAKEKAVAASRKDWIERSYLDIVDFSDAAHPQARDAVEISGSIVGLSHQGNVIYTIGQNSDENGYVLNEQLDALAYDGTNIFYINSLPFSQNWSHPALSDGENLFVADVKNQNGEGFLGVWTLEDSGEFRRLGHVTLSAPADELSFFDDVLAVKSGVQLQLFESKKTGSLKSLGSESAPGDLWFDFDFAAGEKDRGLCVPLGAYGVWRLNLSR
jgi:hypothetical protein